MESEPATGNKAEEAGGGDDAVKDLIGLIEEVGLYGGYRTMQKKEGLNLVRRLKLLVPLIEEIGEIHQAGGGGGCWRYLGDLNKALVAAKKLLKQCSCGSKIYLALENDAVLASFHSVYDKLNQALDDMPYDELGVSVEVREQVELMRMQLKRAKRRTDTQDIELIMDLMVVLSKENADRNADTAILQRLADKLELRNIADLRAETIAMGKLAKKRRQNSVTVQQIERLLEKFKQIVGVESSIGINSSGKTLEKCSSLLVPNEFLCPITLEIMTDPVIIATGQTYERDSIQRWLDSNYRTCPKTGQILTHISLAPNYALQNLIIQWCGEKNIEMPEKNNIQSDSLSREISCLIRDLSSAHFDNQSRAIVELRTLSKENPENRTLIANSGAIPPLVWLLSCPNLRIQENAVTAILNLSLNESNKRAIAREGAIPSIIDILRNGTESARENSAAALFSISTFDENKALVGALNGIPPLVDLLKNGTVRGKKDALTAIFNLTLHQPNKSRAIKAGVIPPLLGLLEDKNLGMVDEALSILRLLATHPNGGTQIGQMSFIRTIVEITKTGTPKNKECATCVLLELGTKNSSCLLAALQFGVYEHLVEIVRTGTSRAQRKASSVLQHMSKTEHIP